MKQSSDLFGAAISGLAISIGISLFTLPLLLSKTYEFEIAQSIINILGIAGILCLAASLATVGVIPVLRRKVETYREAAAGGALSGIIAGAVVFILVGNVYSALVLGVIPFVEYLADPSLLANIDPINAVLRPVVKSVLTDTYLVLFLHLAGGAVLSVVESVAAVWIASRRRKPVK